MPRTGPRQRDGSSTTVTAREACGRWFRTALGDLATAEAILTDRRLPPREAAFLAQQAAEKALKATIALQGTEPPWTHDLLYLRIMAPVDVRTATASIELRPLWAAASTARYPDGGDPPLEYDEVVGLLTDASEIIGIVRLYLDGFGFTADELTAM